MIFILHINERPSTIVVDGQLEAAKEAGLEVHEYFDWEEIEEFISKWRTHYQDTAEMQHFDAIDVLLSDLRQHYRTRTPLYLKVGDGDNGRGKS